MTTGSPSGYLFESRQAMLGLFAKRSTHARGWRRVVVVLVVRFGLGALLAYLLAGMILGAVGIWRAF
jgi:hypothetical protein